MKNLIQIALLVSLLTLSLSCGNKNENKAQDLSEDDHASENTNLVTLTSNQIRTIKLEFARLEKKQLTASLKANGVLKVPNQNRARISTPFGGIITSLLVQTGTQVRKGQPIATLSNPTFVNLQEEYLSTASKAGFAELDFFRQKEMQQGNATSIKIVQLAESELAILKARKISLEKQLGLIGINVSEFSADNMKTEITVYSPISGSVSDVNVTLGSFLDANLPVAEIIDNSQIHLDLFVYERDIAKLTTGQIIHFELTNNPGKEYDAKIFGISNTFEQDSKAIAVHAVVEGNKTGLIDGMNITAIVSLESSLVDAVPAVAILNDDGKDFIFITSDPVPEPNASSEITETDITFERVQVVKGTTELGFSEITPVKPLPENVRIAGKGAFFILAKLTNSGGHHD
ncbi:MAG: efflux RND transporter periplasmic adaptor subunit [Bacteroidetes bacterium]|nr:efflux RND transporter periplasmic adaptor subunit [Bacteroidota bacterium]